MFAFCENKNIYIWTGLYVCMSTNVHILKNYLLGHIWTGKNVIRLHIQCNNITEWLYVRIRTNSLGDYSSGYGQIAWATIRPDTDE